jgi:hypothetical protein
MPGDWVRVRSAAEVLATLDSAGKLDGLPFMPEMLRFCGRRFRVYKRANTTCDLTSDKFGLRRMKDTVHLAMLRCSGEDHGGCQAGCTLFWKEAWLEREPGEPTATKEPLTSGEGNASVAHLQLLEQCTRRAAPPGNAGEYYSCQTTEVARASQPVSWWDVRQHWREVTTNGASLRDVMRGLWVPALNFVVKVLTWKRRTYPNIRGRLQRTPFEDIHLQPGELVEVKSHDEILATLDRGGRNRGMLFDAEMLRYCGRRFRVLRRVEKILDEKTGRLVRLPNPSIILNDVICTGSYHRSCSRASFPFWREIWLRRVVEAPSRDEARQPTADETTLEEQRV